MKKILLIILTLVQLFMISVSADTLTTDNIDTTFQIGAFIVAGTNEGKYLLDNQNNILGGPYELISNYNEFPYAQNFDGSWEMYDVDGKVFAQVEKGGEISPPVNGLYAILRGSDNWHLCNIFELYDYNTKQLLHTFDGTIMFYHELQHEKMFIYKNGKYAICDKYGNFLTDLKTALEKIPALRAEFWENVNVLGSEGSFNQNLERAGRVADFLEFAEVLTLDALHRKESCGGHFREESQTPEGEAKRDDENFCYVGAWEYKGDGVAPELSKEPLTFDNVHLATRSYK